MRAPPVSKKAPRWQTRRGVFVYPWHMAVSAKQMRRVHGVLTWFWIALWIAASIFGWLASVTFVSHVSMAALVLTSWSAHQGARAEHEAGRND